jgi:cytidylate kinase
LIIAIDGPAGSGKSTTARAVAERLGYLYLDTGAMYRAVALAFLRAGAEMTAEAAERLLPGVRIDLVHAEGRLRVLLGGEDVSEAIRRTDVGAGASHVALLPAVRAKLVDEQRRIARGYEAAGGGVVLDGRDIGTVVFPEADVKVFMVADPEVRAARRREELARRGEAVAYASVLEELRQRDRQDAERALAPLRKAADAVELDTTALGFEAQVERVLQLVQERRSGSAV